MTKYIIFIFFFIFSVQAFTYDKFDLLVCEAIANNKESKKCIADLKGNFEGAEIPTTEAESAEKNRKHAKQKISTSIVVNKNSFRQVGYFKDSAKNRIFTIEMKASINKSQAYTFAKNKPYTKGRITVVYFYNKGSVIPADGITMARNIQRVNHVLYDMKGLDPWRYVFMKHRGGDETFVDCKNNNALCRNKH